METFFCELEQDNILLNVEEENCQLSHMCPHFDCPAHSMNMTDNSINALDFNND